LSEIYNNYKKESLWVASSMGFCLSGSPHLVNDYTIIVLCYVTFLW